jgi:hypothetical protein
MVRGLELFRQFFAAHAHQYVLIGGTAATLALEAGGLPFRATKDLDVVLQVEALDAAFGEAFWRFVEAGRYETRQVSATGRPNYYRFQKPGDEQYPAMIELFCRAPGGMTLAAGSHLTPVPIDEAVASLSAILLDDDYYEFVLSGRRESDGLSWVGEDRLIPLKAVAWLDLKARLASGESVDARSVRKHAQDVLRLAQLLTPDSRIIVTEKIGRDLGRFLEALAGGDTIDLRALGLPRTLGEISARIRLAYGLQTAGTV